MQGATTVEIGEKYRELSMMCDPNKETEDQQMLAKAYEVYVTRHRLPLVDDITLLVLRLQFD